MQQTLYIGVIWPIHGVTNVRLTDSVPPSSRGISFIGDDPIWSYFLAVWPRIDLDPEM